MKLPSGFRFAGIRCNIKESDALDLAVVVANQPCLAAGVYTQNLVCAASIDWNRAITPTNDFRGLVINSGNANACTGEQGKRDNRQMAVELANQIDSAPEQICVLSTGVIGHHLPMESITKGVSLACQSLGESAGDFEDAAAAILTTDRSAKTVLKTVEIGGQKIHVAAMAKGAGMIGPNMATMLAVILTDARIELRLAQPMLERIADRSFNRISVEGHTSTNDALLLLASGEASGMVMSEEELVEFESALNEIAIELAKQIPADGEGASHLVSISVSGTENDAAADQIARSIAQSNLVKTAITGADPNWGRIVSAAGYAGVPLTAAEIRLVVNGFELFCQGAPVEFDAAKVSQSISASFETRIELSVGLGPGTAEHWTSDLTVEYVRFNSEYHT